MNERFIGFYDGITPESSSEEFMDDIIRKAEAMRTTESIKHRTVKRVPAAIAAAAVLSVGAGTAAATGLLDFNSSFGKVITAEDQNTANALVSNMKDISWRVSDEDYIIIPKGVTGTERSFIASFEIARADGEPVSEHLLYQPTQKELFSTYSCNAALTEDEMESYGSGVDKLSFTLNENGNIDVVIGMTCSADIVGRRISMNFADLYEMDRLSDFLNKNDINTTFCEAGTSVDHSALKDATVYDAEFFSQNGTVPADIDTGDIVLHELDWQMEFVYEPSAAAVRKLTAADVSESFTEMLQVDRDEYIYIPCSMEKIELNSVNAVLSYRTERAVDDRYNDITYSQKLDVFLVTRNGDHIATDFAFGCVEEQSDGTVSSSVTLRMTDDSGSSLAVDLSDIAAISVNGTVYALS